MASRNPAYYSNHPPLKHMAEQAAQDSVEWFGDTGAHTLPMVTLCLAGEVGEFANIVKKVARRSLTHEQAEDALKDELADVFTYLLDIAGMMDMDLAEEYYKKREFNERRFTAEKARRQTQEAAVEIDNF